MQRVDGHCAWCGRSMSVPVRPQGGGRTKIYCSAGCKQAAYRAQQSNPKETTAAEIDPYANPTDEEWTVIEQRFQKAEHTWNAANAEYFAAFEVWKPAFTDWQTEFNRWKRLKALRTPVRDYVLEWLDPSHGISWRRPPTATKIDPYHRPTDVQQVLDELITEGKIRRIGQGYEWIKAERLSA